ncbi:MAG: asparagine synthase C-terminal domain-containing protein [Candidatus Thorarchaeota archaeon]
MGAVCMICGRIRPDDAIRNIETMYKTLKHRGAIKIVEREYDLISAIIGIIKKDDFTIKLQDDLEQSITIIEKMGNFQDTTTDQEPEALHITIDKRGATITRGNLYMRGAFYTERNNILYFATEQKALSLLGLQNITRLETGHQIQYNGREIPSVHIDHLLEPLPQNEDIPKDQLVEELTEALLRSFKRFQGLDTGILFSGGVDSGLVAHLSKRFCNSTSLYSVNAEESHDARAAVRAAELLDIKLQNITIDADTTWNLLPEVIYAIEDSNRMNVAIALPFMVAAKAARRDGHCILLSGQGPDELFAGYARHVKIMQEEGPKALDRELQREVSITHRANLERDEKAVAYGGCNLIFPYLYNDFITIALGIQSKWKIRIDGSVTRKYIFRELAQELGVPEEIAWAPKRATQFSSSSDKLMIDAVYANIGRPNNLSRNRSEKIVQVVLNRIEQELGFSSGPTTPEYDIDWSPVITLVRNSSILQQSVARQ